MYLWDLQKVAMETKPEDSSQIDPSMPSSPKWTVEGKFSISFHPKDCNRLELRDYDDTLVYNVDDGKERPEDKMEGCVLWSQDGETKVVGSTWTHFESKK